MGEMLEALHRLQIVETQLAEIRSGREAKERRVTAHQQLVAKAEARLADRRRTMRERQMRLDTLQLEVNSREESVNRHRQALNTAKTNKEYAAILTAMNTEKADNTKIEAEMLQLMEEVDKFKGEIAEIEAEIAKHARDVERAEEGLAAFDAETKSRRDELQTQHEEFAEAVPPTTLNLFTRVAQHHDGVGMVPVSKIHPKRDEYVCSGCNMKITLEVVNSLLVRDDFQSCRTCGRILYVEQPAAQKSKTKA